MSILKQDLNEEEVYFNFINSLKSEVTKKEYEREIRLFMKFCNVVKLSCLLTEVGDPQKQIIGYITSLKERGLSYNSISLPLYAIYHFYEMNDVPLNKKKINMFKGEFLRRVSDRAYTYEEITKLLDISDLRMKSIILLMASSGIRIGSIPLLRLRNLEKIDSIYKITVYEGTNEEYFTFCTPECRHYIDAYLEFRTQKGEKLNGDSYLVREQFDITDIEQVRNRSKAIALSTIKGLIHKVLINAGVKTVDHTSYNRKDVPESHGFRKFFTTQVVNAEVNPEIREMLLGHKIGLASCYYRPTQEKMYQEYLKTVNNLMINEENRLKLKLEKVQIEKNKLDELKADFDAFKQEVLKQRKRS
jgi:integrase